MTGSEKQIAYANQLRENYIKYNCSFSNLSDETKKIKIALESFNGYAGDLIDCVKHKAWHFAETMPKCGWAKLWREKFLNIK